MSVLKHCPECDSVKLSWTADMRRGFLVLGCDECSATVASLDNSAADVLLNNPAIKLATYVALNAPEVPA